MCVVLGDMIHVQRGKDLLLQELQQWLPGHLLDNGRRQNVPGIGVLPVGAGLEVERPAGPLIENGFDRSGMQHLRGHKILRPEITQSRSVGQHLAHGHFGRIAQVGKPLSRRVVEGQFTLLDQQQHGRRGELFRHRVDGVTRGGCGGGRGCESCLAVGMRVGNYAILYHRDGGGRRTRAD